MVKQFGTTMFLLVLTACQSMGPRNFSTEHASYGESIATSLDEQFLQNIVRLRYRETPFFLEVGSVTSSSTFNSSLGVGSDLSIGGGTNLVTPSAGVGYSSSPTVFYSPLQGEEFLRKLLVTVPIETLFLLTQSGWSVDRVMGLCVERINHLHNASSASGPTPDVPPGVSPRFDRFINLFEGVRHQELVRYDLNAESGEIRLQIKQISGDAEVANEMKELLGLSLERDTFLMHTSFLERDADSIAIRTRSIMSILFYLSQAVRVPAEHEEAGYVTVTRNSDGSRFDWASTPAGELFRVRHSRVRPASPFLAIPYRGYWFYIANDDLDAKSTFMMVRQLFNLNAGAMGGVRPTLTIPVAR